LREYNIKSIVLIESWFWI